MKIILFLALLGSSCITNAQQLEFAEVSSEPAYCRLFHYQSGNGIVFGYANGGTSPYTYEWKNLDNGQTSTNTTWGGLNPGSYQITAWDAVNDSIFQTIELDSVNPQASFDVVSAGLSPQGNDLFWGEASVDVDFVNTSTGVLNFNDPFQDTTFFWKMTQFQDFYQVTSFTTESYTYDFGGTWGVTLVAINKNGCSDTAKAHIWLNGTVGLEDVEAENFAWFSDNRIRVQMHNEGNYDLQLLDLNGRLIKKEKFSGKSTSTDFNYTEGLYLVLVKAEGEVKFIKKIVVN